MRKLILSVLCLISINARAGIEKEKITVNFETNSFKLTEKAKIKLTSFIKDINLEKDFQITLTGHTDNRGSYTYNDSLSLKRSNSVRLYLLEEGIGRESVQYEYHGERRPVEANIDLEKMKKNRRVEVTYTSFYFQSEAELLDSLSRPYVQRFTIDPTLENQLETNHGIELSIHPNSFVDEEGEKIREEVHLTVKEALDYQSFIAHNLMTISDNSMIESDGMFKIEARTNTGRNVRLDSNSAIKTSLPTERIKENMELFISDDGQNWTSTGPIETQKEGGKKKKKNALKLVKIPDFKYKKFIADKKTMPKPPVKPKLPGTPHEPRLESYQINTFWSKIFKKRAQRISNERYLAAMDKYIDKVAKYEVYMANYLHKKERFDDRKEQYKKDYSLWLEKQRKLADEDYAKQVKLYQETFSVEIKENEKRTMLFREELQARKEARLVDQAESMDSAASSSLNAARMYTFNVLSMNWINCDRFINTEERVLAVWDNDDSDEMVQLIFPNQSGLMSLTKIEDAYTLNYKIPVDEKMIVFALKVIDGRPYIYYHEVKDQEENLEMEFQVTRFSDLKGLLDDLKRNNTAAL